MKFKITTLLFSLLITVSGCGGGSSSGGGDGNSSINDGTYVGTQSILIEGIEDLEDIVTIYTFLATIVNGQLRLENPEIGVSFLLPLSSIDTTSSSAQVVNGAFTISGQTAYENDNSFDYTCSGSIFYEGVVSSGTMTGNISGTHVCNNSDSYTLIGNFNAVRQ